MNKMLGGLRKKKELSKSEQTHSSPTKQNSVDYLRFDPEINKGLFKKKGADELLQMLDKVPLLHSLSQNQWRH